MIADLIFLCRKLRPKQMQNYVFQGLKDFSSTIPLSQNTHVKISNFAKLRPKWMQKYVSRGPPCLVHPPSTTITILTPKACLCWDACFPMPSVYTLSFVCVWCIPWCSLSLPCMHGCGRARALFLCVPSDESCFFLLLALLPCVRAQCSVSVLVRQGSVLIFLITPSPGRYRFKHCIHCEQLEQMNILKYVSRCTYASAILLLYYWWRLKSEEVFLFQLGPPLWHRPLLESWCVLDLYLL